MSHEWAKALVATAVLVVLIVVALPVKDWRTESQSVESLNGEAATDGSDAHATPRNLAESLFGWKDASGRFQPGYVFPFEVLSVLLLGALIAALYVGAKTKREFGGGPQ